MPLGKRRKQKTTSSTPGFRKSVPVRRDRRVLVEQVEDHREVVDAERPERVLVLADRPEVLAVAVDAEHLAEVARVDELLQLADAGVVEQQMARHQHLPAGSPRARRARPSRRRASRAASRRRRACPPRAPAWRARSASAPASRSRPPRASGSASTSSKLAGRERVREPRARTARAARREVADPDEVGEDVDVADEVRAPGAEAGDADPDGVATASTPCRSTSWPFVALRKSTTTLRARTTSA